MRVIVIGAFAAEPAPPMQWHVSSSLQDLLVSALLVDEDAGLLRIWRPLAEVDIAISRWWRKASAGAGVRDCILSSLYAADHRKLHGSAILRKFPTFWEDAVPLAGGAAFLRLPDGIASGLSLVLGLILALLTRHPDVSACWLLMLAAGLGYGRGALGDRACSPARIRQTSVRELPVD